MECPCRSIVSLQYAQDGKADAPAPGSIWLAGLAQTFDRKARSGLPMDEPVVIGDLTLSRDVSPADWVVAQVRDFGSGVGSLVPPGFEAHAQLFHPAYEGGEERELRWEQVAAIRGRQAHQAMQWGSIAGSWRVDMQPRPQVDEPRRGSLPHRQAARLAEVLSEHTDTPGRCWFGVWDGFGALAVPREGVPRVQMPRRPMLLLCGPASAVTTSLEGAPAYQLANLWWPDDRAWCVATDIDLWSTYIAGSAACIAALVDDAELEVLPASVDQRVAAASDSLNPPTLDLP